MISNLEQKEIRYHNNRIGNIGRRLESTKNIIFKEMPKEYESRNVIEYYNEDGEYGSRHISYKTIIALKNRKRFVIFFLLLNTPEWEELYYYKELKE